ncbi:methionyl-tRNA formyltransferase [Corynebacterium sp. SCR221107]|uniref:methionyl-tRNA formyltransferase n=1 Tax=Corynebacterium sp. SCR221107 TaxID=3017361 RepID=UPI0022EC53E1|nr:methionyl-tRNA formyltransferase [Corynebacterium sp. SCR221107]WBT10059.1 methionyl-tRNA formyltransferase [Corynebacterium sp. SCR221107]
MRLIFAGTPEPAVVALEELLASEHEVIAVLTRPDAPKGRGRTLHPSPVAALAQRKGIEVLTPATLKGGTADGEAFRARLRELAPDCVPVVAYGNLIPGDILDMVPEGFINLHFSLLPRWRGAAPVQAAIAAGDDVTGASTFRIDEGLDTGEVYGVLEQPISATDTVDSLLTTLAFKGAVLLRETMDRIADGTVSPKPQRGEPTHVGKISVEDARIDWHKDAAHIERNIRAVTPVPGAWTQLAGQRFKVGPITISDDPGEKLAPGHVRVEKKRVVVGTGSNNIELGDVQAQGKKRMQASDWARGLHETEGVIFE